MPEIAVVTPVYNGAAFIARAMDSVLAQTLPATEIVVVDDGSTDGTPELLRERYGDRVRVLCQQQQGPASARNAGLRATSAGLVAFLDADDWWEPGKLAAQVEALERNPKAVATYTAISIVDEMSGEVQRKTAADPATLATRLRVANPGIVPASLMVRRSALEAVGGFDERQCGCEDWGLLKDLIERGPFVAIDEPLTNYHQSPKSLSRNPDRMYQDFLRMLDGRLLRGLGGLDRVLWRRRAISVQAYACAMTSRLIGDTPAVKRYLGISLSAWPFPTGPSPRYRALAVALLRGR